MSVIHRYFRLLNFYFNFIVLHSLRGQYTTYLYFNTYATLSLKISGVTPGGHKIAFCNCDLDLRPMTSEFADII